MNKPDKSSIFKSSLLVALLGAAFGSHAAGLGKLTVYSAIGQPLSAEVALTATPEELNGLSAKLASHSAFSDAGIDFMPALTGLRFNVAKLSSGQSVLRLTTESPLNEPFLHFLVELNWTAGRMVREYTFLLDPPEMLQVAKPASVVAPVAPYVQAVAKPAPARAPLQVSRPSVSHPAQASEGEYRVKSGDTLSKIARENKIEAVSLDQMLVALFNNNRDVFDGNNMNRLRAGKILRLPNPAEAALVDAGEARKLIVSQAADFNAYRRRLADAAGSAPVAESAAQQEVAGKIKAQVEAKTPPLPVTDKLEVSRTEAAKSARAGSGKGSLEEDLIARDKSLREAAERIAQLEKNLENLKHLVELKSQPGAQIQQQAQVAAVAKQPTAEEKKPESPAVKPAESTSIAQSVAPVSPPATVAEGQAEAAKPAAETTAPVVAPSPAPPKPAVRKTVPPPPPPQPSFVEDNPELVFGGGGLIALLLGYFGYTAWRKKKQAHEEGVFDDHPSVSESDLASKSGTVFGAASESVDSGEVSIQGDFSEGGVLTTEESVDPVAEADVLMAYGRDGQAEEILKEGLKTDPTRGAIHLKLLELYTNRKSIDQFQMVARDLYALNQGQGGEWEKAAAFARDLGVTSNLFPAGVVTTSGAELIESASVPESVVDQAANETAITTAVPLPQETLSSVEAESGSLDFDLDLGTTSGPAIAAAAEQAEAKPAEEVMSLDFDFDLGTPEASAAEVAPEVPVPVADVESAVSDGNAIDFSFDSGSSELPSASGPEPITPPPAAVVVESDEISFDLDLGSAEETSGDTPVSEATPSSVGGLGDVGLDFDLDLGSDDSAVDASAPATDAPVEMMPAVLDLADISLDLGELEAEETPLPVAASVAEVALPGAILPAEVMPVADSEADFSLDIGDVAVPAEMDVPAVEPAAHLSMDLPDIDLPSVAEHGEPLQALPEMDFELGSPISPEGNTVATAETDDPEVATKLELAQAYEEMGDREGARELLNEVVNEGSAVQQLLARSRLDQLDT